MCALSSGIHEHRARAVDDVARGDLATAGLQHVFHFAACAARDLLVHAEDRADGHVHVDVGRAVERIEQQHVLAVPEAFRNVDDVRLFLGRHGAEPSAVVERLDDDLVRNHVELLLHLTLHVDVGCGSQDVGQAGASHLVGDHLPGKRHVVQDAGELPGGLGMLALLVDDEAFDRDDRCGGVLDHGQAPEGGRESWEAE